MTATQKIESIKSLGQAIIDSATRCEIRMPWMIDATEDEFAASAVAKAAEYAAMILSITK